MPRLADPSPRARAFPGRPPPDAPLTARQRDLLALRHFGLSAPLTFERLAERVKLTYPKVLVEYARAKATVARLKRLARDGAELGPEARADLERFGGLFW